MDPRDIELVKDAIGLIAAANLDEFMEWRNHDRLSQAMGKLDALLTFHNAGEEEE